MDEYCPFELDISDLLTDDDEILSVVDMDYPIGPQSNVSFDVDSQFFTTLKSREIIFNDSQNVTRIKYQPRIAVAKQLNAADSPILFTLTATVRTKHFLMQTICNNQENSRNEFC